MKKAVNSFILITLLSFIVIEQTMAQTSFTLQRISSEPLRFPQIADINRDGHTDIVAILDYNPYQQSTLVWLRGPGWNMQRITTLPYVAQDFNIADLNNDGYPDIIGQARLKTDSIHKGTIFMMENPGPSLNTPSPNWQLMKIGSSRPANTLFSGHFNQDSLPDVVVSLRNKTHIFMQEQAGHWNQHTISNATRHDMKPADIDLDGDNDLVMPHFWVQTPDLTGETWYHFPVGSEGNDTGIKGGTDHISLAVNDLDGDFLPDVVRTGIEPERTLLKWLKAPELSNEAWSPDTLGYVWDTRTLLSADFNNNGHQDVLSLGLTDTSHQDTFRHTSVHLFTNQYKGKQWKKQAFTFPSVMEAEAHDIDRDGDMDVLASLDEGKGLVWLMNQTTDNPLSLDQWDVKKLDAVPYKQPEGNINLDLRFSIEDITGDDYPDILAGEYIWQNPGKDDTSQWKRIQHHIADSPLIPYRSGEKGASILSLKCNNQYQWIHDAPDFTKWEQHKIGPYPLCGHASSLNAFTEQLLPGGAPEIFISNKKKEEWGYMVRPHNDRQYPWRYIRLPFANNVARVTEVMDYNEDHLPDVPVAIPATSGSGIYIGRLQNPGVRQGEWPYKDIGMMYSRPESLMPVFLDKDRVPDMLAIHRKGETMHLTGFLAPDGKRRKSWQKNPWGKVSGKITGKPHDFDRDGDSDLLLKEKQEEHYKIMLLENAGAGHLIAHKMTEVNASNISLHIADINRDGYNEVVVMYVKEGKKYLIIISN